jgi:hypothetical protein
VLAILTLPIAVRVTDEEEAREIAAKLQESIKIGMESELLGQNATHGTDVTPSDLGEHVAILEPGVFLVPSEVYA